MRLRHSSLFPRSRNWNSCFPAQNLDAVLNHLSLIRTLNCFNVQFPIFMLFHVLSDWCIVFVFSKLYIWFERVFCVCTWICCISAIRATAWIPHAVFFRTFEDDALQVRTEKTQNSWFLKGKVCLLLLQTIVWLSERLAGGTAAGDRTFDFITSSKRKTHG